MATQAQTQKELDISCQGMDLFMNNDWDGCEALFRQHKDESPFMLYCHSYITFLIGLMRFDEAVTEKAQKGFEKVEKVCNESLKQKKLFKLGPGLPNFNVAKALTDSKSNTESALEDQINKSLIVAESKLYLAIVDFMKQEMTGFIKGGLQIKRSWKLFSRIQKQLYEMYKKIEPNAESIYGCDSSSNVIQLQIEGDADDDKDADAGSEVLESLDALKIADKDGSLSPETIKRLLGAVSYGYGLYQIIFSLTPPSMLKVVRVLGFQADRNVGIKALNFTSNSKDMRAPLADLILLGYGVILTPMLGLTESDLTINIDDIQSLLKKNQTKYPKSAFFYFYRGQYLRSQKKLEECLKNQEEAYENAKENPDIQLISVEEMGWLSLINSDYARAFGHFHMIFNRTKWYRPLYAYFCGVIQGCLGDFAQANEFIKESLKLAQASQKKRKNFQIEDFSLKRVEYLKKNPIKSKNICQFLVVELLYLWVCYPCCEEKQLNKFLEICDGNQEKSLTALKCLFEGAIQMEMKNFEFGEQCLNECLARMESDKVPFGKYAVPCANYILGKYYLDTRNYDAAKTHLNKASSYSKEYEFEYHIQTLVQSSLRRCKYLTETSAVAVKK